MAVSSVAESVQLPSVQGGSDNRNRSHARHDHVPVIKDDLAIEPYSSPAKLTYSPEALCAGWCVRGEEVGMDRGLIGTIIGVLVVIILVIVILQLA
jgi:hypothetical protein